MKTKAIMMFICRCDVYIERFFSHLSDNTTNNKKAGEQIHLIFFQNFLHKSCTIVQGFQILWPNHTFFLHFRFVFSIDV